MTSKNPTVSVVSVTYYTGVPLFAMIESVLKQDGLAELVLVNNGNPLSIVHQLEDLAENNSKIKFISGQSNVGFACGNNLGARDATGDYVLFLNPDCFVEDGFLFKLMNSIKSLPRPVLLGTRILDADGHEQSGSRRDALTPWKAFIEVFSLYKFAPNHPHFQRWKWHEDVLPDALTEVPAISGALMFMHRDDYWLVNGLDEDYFLHVEDIDFCHRFRKMGGSIFFHPHLSVQHIGATSDVPKMIVELHKTRSFVRYFNKNFADSYPRFFLSLVNAATWGRFVMQAIYILSPFGKTGKKSRG
jgi:N-acetylglucosaminyl-diphospho-decaprenol L-rhamnosyltransferase